MTTGVGQHQMGGVARSTAHGTGSPRGVWARWASTSLGDGRSGCSSDCLVVDIDGDGSF